MSLLLWESANRRSKRRCIRLVVLLPLLKARRQRGEGRRRTAAHGGRLLGMLGVLEIRVAFHRKLPVQNGRSHRME
jgi:hypothetical protein